jgi:metal-responsive CopG/Arc/MetJ family transcriptional regulator
MPSIRVELDDATYRALNQVAPAVKRKRAEFIRAAITEAIRKREYADMREAYRKQPDSASDSDSWSNCEKYSGTMKVP